MTPELKPPSLFVRILCAVPLAFVVVSIGFGLGWYVHPGAGLAAAGLVLWIDSLVAFARARE